MAKETEVLKSARKKVASSKKKGSYVGFKALAEKTSPAIAAAIGRKKYGAKGMAALAAAGRKKSIKK